MSPPSSSRAPSVLFPSGSMREPCFSAERPNRAAKKSITLHTRLMRRSDSGMRRGAAPATGAERTHTTTAAMAGRESRRRIAETPFRGWHALGTSAESGHLRGDRNRLLLQVYSEEATTRALADMERHDECPDTRILLRSTKSRYAQREKLKLARKLNQPEKVHWAVPFVPEEGTRGRIFNGWYCGPYCCSASNAARIAAARSSAARFRASGAKWA